MEPIIRLDNIQASYEQKQVLQDVSLTVYDHDYLGIIGPNGGGKTTLIRVMLGLKKPERGTVTYFRDGKPAKEIRMGYLPQYSLIDRQFPIAVYDVVLSGLSQEKKLWRRFSKEQHERAAETLRQMQLDDLARRAIGELSGGQLQRVLLARAVVSRPDVLVLDEPNTYIDKRYQAQMYEMLEQFNHDCAIVIVSHDIAEVLQNAKHVACVNRHLHYHDHPHIDADKFERHFLEM